MKKIWFINIFFCKIDYICFNVDGGFGFIIESLEYICS